MLLLYTIREKLWIIPNPKIKTQLNKTRAEKGKKSLVLFKKRKRDEKHNHTKRCTARVYTLPVIFTVTVCGCVRLWLCVSVYDERKNATQGRRIAHRPGVTHHTHTTETSLSLQPGREVLFRANCNSTLASWRTEPPDGRTGTSGSESVGRTLKEQRR